MSQSKLTKEQITIIKNKRGALLNKNRTCIWVTSREDKLGRTRSDIQIFNSKRHNKFRQIRQVYEMLNYLRMDETTLSLSETQKIQKAIDSVMDLLKGQNSEYEHLKKLLEKKIIKIEVYEKVPF